MTTKPHAENRDWRAEFEARLSLYGKGVGHPDPNFEYGVSHYMHGSSLPSHSDTAVIVRITERLITIRRMLNEYRIALHEHDQRLSVKRAAAESYVMTGEMYSEAKNDAARKIIMAKRLETGDSVILAEYRLARDLVAWYKNEVSRIEVELESVRDIRRAMELENALRGRE